MADDCADGSRSNREIGKIGFDAVAIEIGGVERVDRFLDERSAVFAGYDQSAFDLPLFNHARRNRQRVEKPNTGIRDVKDLSRCRQTDLMMRECSRGGFKHVPADRTMNEELDLIRIDRGFDERGLPRCCTRVRRLCALGPDSTFFDPRHQFESTFGQP